MYEVVVGIDFGSSGTGYAFSYNDTQNIQLGKFQGQTTETKVPTEIILDSDLRNIKAFGPKCSNYKLEEGDLYFKGIKMNIYYNDNYIKPENNFQNYLLVDIISKIFEHIKKDAIKSIKENKPNILEDKIKWVVTVPSIWNLHQKGIMIKSCEKAGLFNNFTDRANFLALEPEAASLYCSYDNSIDNSYLMTGKAYIVCDLGGGTGDLVTDYRKTNDKIVEIYKPVGGPYGSEEIEIRIFNDVIGKIFGFSDYISLKDKFMKIKSNQNERPSNFEWDEVSLYSYWHELKNKISINKTITNSLRGETFLLSCQIFEDFTDGLRIRDLINKYNNSCPEGWNIEISNEKFWILKIPYKIIFDLIEEHASKISEQISEIISNVDNIESILYVGGYSSNEVLINYLKEKFPKLQHLKPSFPERAVVKGAVIFGISPYIINTRKSRFTIGFNCDDIWDEKIHGGKGEKYWDPIYQVFKCRNAFHAFIRKGQDLTQDVYIEQSFITMNSRIIVLKFFKSFNEYPVVTTEKGVEVLFNEQFDLGRDYPPEERNFILKMNFGGTYTTISLYHEKSGRTFSFPLYFGN